METTTPRINPESRSLAALLSDLWRHTTTLVRDETELAKAELSEKASQAGSGLSSLAIGGAIAFAGFLLLLIALANGLAQMLPPEVASWLAPLIVGAIVLIAGLIALSKGRESLKTSKLMPTRTTASLRNDARLAKEHLK